MQASPLSKPRLTVAAIVQQQERFLMVEEYNGTLIVLNQPAGHVEVNETPLAAIVRETIEETAWKVQPTAIIGCYYYTPPMANTSYFRICYLAQCLEYTNQTLDKDIIGAKWLSYAEIKNRHNQLRSPLVLRCMEDFLKGQRYPLNLITSL